MNKNPNSSTGFQFKQFAIQHNQCAMKVGTDGILLGSWSEPYSAKRILDIGSGSGLLAIMMAQKTLHDAHITGVDIDQATVNQANENAKHSPWTTKLNFVCSDILEFNHQEFDFIISNPPFFTAQNGKISESDANYILPKRRVARHQLQLTLTDLFDKVSELLSANGRFNCILPFMQTKQTSMHDLAQRMGLYCANQTHVFSVTGKPPFRQLLSFTKVPQKTKTHQLLIYEKDRQYSAEYKSLCRDYYLNF